MENWKIIYHENEVITAGDLGRVTFYDDTSKEKIKRVDNGELFLTALTHSPDHGFLATGNTVGDLYITTL